MKESEREWVSSWSKKNVDKRRDVKKNEMKKEKREKKKRKHPRGWGNSALPWLYYVSIRVMSFRRLCNSQFDAFVSNFVHEFNWFLIRSIYSCHVSLIIIGQAICFSADGLIWLKYFNTKRTLGQKANDFHVECIMFVRIHSDVYKCLCLHVCGGGGGLGKSLATNGTSASKRSWSFPIYRIDAESKTKDLVQAREGDMVCVCVCVIVNPNRNMVKNKKAKEKCSHLWYI